MRQGQNPKRARGRGRKPGNQPNRTFDSNGPDVKIRGSASQIFDKYQTLARDATSSGDRIAAENYLQHAEHYLRLLNAMQHHRTMDTTPPLRANGAALDGDTDEEGEDENEFEDNGGAEYQTQPAERQEGPGPRRRFNGGREGDRDGGRDGGRERGRRGNGRGEGGRGEGGRGEGPAREGRAPRAERPAGDEAMASGESAGSKAEESEAAS
jgi:hypothetical protein